MVIFTLQDRSLDAKLYEVKVKDRLSLEMITLALPKFVDC
jgi:hypothetical protein